MIIILQIALVSMLKLPTDKNGNPDWKFMENYVKSFPYGDMLEN